MPTPRKAAATKAAPETAGADTASGDGEGTSLPDAPASAPTSDPHADTWAALTAPFPSSSIEKLPKPVARDGEKGRCDNARISADGHYCGGWHSRAVHLDYVGHAGITMRLNEVLGPGGWDFAPYAESPDGLPMLGRDVFYARLTILGVTKWDLAANYNGPQEAFGDALRRCAMRFGVGTYLWSKSDAAATLAASADLPPAEPAPNHPPEAAPEPASQEPPALTRGQQTVQDTIATLTPEEHATMAAWASSNGVPALHALGEKGCANFMEYLEWLVGQRTANPPA